MSIKNLGNIDFMRGASASNYDINVHVNKLSTRNIIFTDNNYCSHMQTVLKSVGGSILTNLTESKLLAGSKLHHCSKNVTE